MSEIQKADLVELYDKLQQQLVEDRMLLLDLFNSLKSQVTTKEDFAMHGQNLGKFAEVLVKQTTQLVELIKINQKEMGEEEIKLNPEDKQEIFKKINNV